jgi:hypothetical protein
MVAECQGLTPQIPSPVYGCMALTPFYILATCFPEIQFVSCHIQLNLPVGLFPINFLTKILYAFFVHPLPPYVPNMVHLCHVSLRNVIFVLLFLFYRERWAYEHNIHVSSHYFVSPAILTFEGINTY